MGLDPRPAPKPGMQMSQRADEPVPPKVGSLLSKWQSYNDDSKKEEEPLAKAPPIDQPDASPNRTAPADMEIMEALLDAFEDDINLGDDKKLARWLNRHGYEKVGEWVDKLNKHDYYRAMASFFGNLAKFRQKQPGLLSGIEEAEEVPGADIRLDDPNAPSVDAEPEAEPQEPDEEPTEKPAFDINSAVMDMYLEGIDITRRSQLIDSLEKNGYDVEVETLSGMSLPDFYAFLSEFFKNLAGALKGGEKDRLPSIEPEPEVAPEEPVAEPEQTPTAEEEAVPGEEIPVSEPEVNPLEVELKGLGASGPVTLSDIAALALKYYSIATVEDRANAEAEIAEKAKALGVELDPQASAAFSAGMSYMEKKTLSPGAKWDQMTPEMRTISLIDGGIDQVAADEYSKYAWDDPSLPYAAKEAFEDALAGPVEVESNTPQIRRNEMRSQLKMEAPEELLPGEISEAEKMAKACVVGGIPLDEAAKRVTAKLGKTKGYPTPIKMKLESYLTALLTGLTEDGVPAPVAAAGQIAPAVAKPVEKPEDDDEEEDEEGTPKDAPKDKDEKPVITGKKGGEDEAKKDEEGEEEGEPKDAPKDEKPEIKGDEDEGKKDEEEEEEGKKDDEEKEGKDKKGDDEEEEEGEEDDDEEKNKAAAAVSPGIQTLPLAAPIATPMGETLDDKKAMGEMLRLSLAPAGKQFGARTTESRRMPKAIQLSEATTGAGVTGARDTGVLDVFSYGGYLERALPYLISASMSRMEDEDKDKFVNIYKKFTETNDIVEMTKLSGGMADVIEWADATQEGAELVKNLRFMSDFLNVLRGSVDFTKKAFPVI